MDGPPAYAGGYLSAQRTEWTLARHPPAYAGGYELARQSLP